MPYAAGDSKIKSEFLVAPCADPGQIRLEYSGADRVFIDPHGDLVVRTGVAELREQAPVAYQEWDGVRRPIRLVTVFSATMLSRSTWVTMTSRGRWSSIL